MKYYDVKLEIIPSIIEFVESRLGEADYPEKCVMQTCMAVEEVVVNIINHGHLAVDCHIEIDTIELPDYMAIIISDRGIPFDPLQSGPADTTSPLMERKKGGLGLFFVKQFIDRIHYLRTDSGNHLYLFQNRRPDSGRTE